MRQTSPFLLLFLLISMSSCDVIADIFKAGFWVGIILVVVIVMIVLFIINKLRRR